MASPPTLLPSRTVMGPPPIPFRTPMPFGTSIGPPPTPSPIPSRNVMLFGTPEPPEFDKINNKEDIVRKEVERLVAEHGHTALMRKLQAQDRTIEVLKSQLALATRKNRSSNNCKSKKKPSRTPMKPPPTPSLFSMGPPPISSQIPKPFGIPTGLPQINTINQKENIRMAKFKDMVANLGVEGALQAQDRTIQLLELQLAAAGINKKDIIRSAKFKDMAANLGVEGALQAQDRTIQLLELQLDAARINARIGQLIRENPGNKRPCSVTPSSLATEGRLPDIIDYTNNRESGGDEEVMSEFWKNVL